MKEPAIILFDGVCNLCNSSVDFVIKHDKKNRFLFTSLQSEAGKNILKKYSLPADDLTSFVLVQEGKAYTKSTAALKVLKQLSSFVSIFYLFMVLPKFIRDAMYNRLADNRYKWFGKKEECMIPTPELKARFLS